MTESRVHNRRQNLARSDVITSRIGGPLHGLCPSVPWPRRQRQLLASFRLLTILRCMAVVLYDVWGCKKGGASAILMVLLMSPCGWICECVACAIIKCRKFHQTLQSSGTTCCCPQPCPVSVYDSIIFTANKRETAYHGQVLNGRQGKLQKFSFLFLFFFFLTVFFFWREQPNLKVVRGAGPAVGVAAEHVKSVEPERCGQQLQGTVRMCVC